jgi:hypothetical protein
MRLLRLVAALFLLAGCASPSAPPDSAPTGPPDVSVTTESVPELAATAIDRYVAQTNAILTGEAKPESIAEVTSGTWAAEEIAGYAVATALEPSVNPTLHSTKSEIARVRGTVTVVDVTMHVCFASANSLTLVSVRLVPREGSLVVDSIRPWEDSTWCAPTEQF